MAFQRQVHWPLLNQETLLVFTVAFMMLMLTFLCSNCLNLPHFAFRQLQVT